MKTTGEKKTLCNEDGMQCRPEDATHYLVNVPAPDGSKQTIMLRLEGEDQNG
jgi:hypothetical protein